MYFLIWDAYSFVSMGVIEADNAAEALERAYKVWGNDVLKQDFEALEIDVIHKETR